ncbi:MAG: CotH kinase family protein [Spirochaetales bacterium]|nr:CotH kinase family protein [Spirochaetales bacterium]
MMNPRTDLFMLSEPLLISRISGKRKIDKSAPLSLLLSIIVLILGCDSVNYHDISINEYMNSNSSFLRDEEMNYPDWVELYNRSFFSINLKGCGLSSDEKRPLDWIFPDIAIKGKSYLVIFISGKNRNFTYQYRKKIFIHTSFTLKRKDSFLLFSNPQGRIIDLVELQKPRDNCSYGKIMNTKDITWTEFHDATPGFENSDKGYIRFLKTCEKERPDVFINELMASNKQTLIDDKGNYSDWIELYNSTQRPISLHNYTLSDRSDSGTQWIFPDILILPRQYLIIFASGQKKPGLHQPYLHTNFKLNARADTLLFGDPEGFILDKVTISNQHPDISFGRSDRDPSTWFLFTASTPGKLNTPEPMSFNDNIDFLPKGGLFTGAQWVSLTGDGDDIFYSLDGSEPDRTSRKYSSPLFLEKNTIIRARAYKKGFPPGKIITYSYFFNLPHTLAIFSLVTDPYYLWDPLRGILSEHNIEKKIENPVHIEFFETDGFPGFRLNAGIRLFGHSTRLMPQRPFYLLTRRKYGQERIRYQVFPDKEIRIFKSLLLRNGGEDGHFSRIRDAFTTTLARELGIDAQASRPVVLYLNGNYWGQYFLRDKIDEYFLAYEHTIADPKNIDLIEGNRKVMSGNAEALTNLTNYFSTHDLREREAYEYVQTHIDINNLINYELAQIYFANTDMGNIRFWKERAPHGKWRWILFDTDWSLFSSERDAFHYNLDPAGRGYLQSFSTLIITSLLKNSDFKEKFISRCIQLLNTTFSPGHTETLIENLVQAIENEMPAHFERWDRSVSAWKREVDRVRHFTKERTGYMLEHLKRYFSISDEEIKAIRSGL